MFEAQYQAESGKWVLLDACAFETLEQAGLRVIKAVEAGMPQQALLFRIVDLGGEHLDDCPMGIGGVCDCRAPVVVVQGRMQRGGEGYPYSIALFSGTAPVGDVQSVRADDTVSVLVGKQEG